MTRNLTTGRCRFWLERRFNECRELYRTSFPPEERRSTMCQTVLLATEPHYHCLRLDEGGAFAGLLFYWEHEQFIYVEHLAIVPERRGQGLGRKALELVCQRGLPVILEIELVVNEGTERRWQFYRSAGFHCLPYPHVQPRYNHGDPYVEMALLSYPHAVGIDIIGTYELFMQEVVSHYTENVLRGQEPLALDSPS